MVTVSMQTVLEYLRKVSSRAKSTFLTVTGYSFFPLSPPNPPPPTPLYNKRKLYFSISRAAAGQTGLMTNLSLPRALWQGTFFVPCPSYRKWLHTDSLTHARTFNHVYYDKQQLQMRSAAEFHIILSLREQAW